MATRQAADDTFLRQKINKVSTVMVQQREDWEKVASTWVGDVEGAFKTLDL